MIIIINQTIYNAFSEKPRKPPFSLFNGNYKDFNIKVIMMIFMIIPLLLTIMMIIVMIMTMIMTITMIKS